MTLYICFFFVNIPLNLILEETQCLEDDGLLMGPPRNVGLMQSSIPQVSGWPNVNDWNSTKSALIRRIRNSPKPTPVGPQSAIYPQVQQGVLGWQQWNDPMPIHQQIPLAPVTTLQVLTFPWFYIYSL